MHQPSHTIIQAEPCEHRTPRLTHLHQSPSYDALLAEFPLLTSKNQNPPELDHGVRHNIITSGPPCFARYKHLAPDRLQAAQEEFEHMLQEGTAHPSDSSWASPLHMVP